jgi:peroxiredoxin
MAVKVKVGDRAKDFTLSDQHGKKFQLSKLRGKKRVLLSFHPLAWTGLCAKQMKSLDRYKERFDGLRTVAVGLSIDSVPCKAAWAKSLKLRSTRILADFWPHGEVARKYGVFNEARGFAERANIIIDEKGRIVFYKVYPIKQLPSVSEVVTFLKRL